jgi:hypothetical protein
MSGKPYPEGVSRVLDALAELDTIDSRMAELAPLVQKLTKELTDAKDRWSELTVEVAALLDKMDLSAQGNFGFGGRMGWFVKEMRRQILNNKGDAK